MQKHRRDALSVIDAAYGHYADESAWTEAVHCAVLDAFGTHTIAAVCDTHSAGYTVAELRALDRKRFWFETALNPPYHARRFWAYDAPSRGVMSKTLQETAGNEGLAAWHSRSERHAVGDLHFFRTTDSAINRMVTFVRPVAAGLPNEMFGPWYEGVANHLNAAMRLRHRPPSTPDRVDVVLDPDGRSNHRAVAVDEHEQEELSAVVATLERASHAAADPLWPALVAGRWTLVRYADTDARRFYLAARTHDEVVNPCALTEREREIARRVANGETNQSVGLDIGLSTSAIAAIVDEVLRKLRLHRRLDLPWLVHGALRRTWSDAEDAFAAWESQLDAATLDRLSPAERAVAVLLVRGLSNAEIAAERGTAVRTVANQVRSIAGKLGVSGRMEIAVALIEGG